MHSPGKLTSGQAAAALSIAALLAFVYGRAVYAPCDDAYIFYVYAKNLVNGNGLTYNGIHVQGFTSVVWVLLLCLFGLLRAPVHVLAEVLSVASGAFALWATYYLGRSLSLGRLHSLLPAFLLAVTGDFALYMAVGLEQALFTGLVAVVTAMVLSPGGTQSLKGYALPAVMAAAILTRPEGALICAALGVVWAFRVRSFWPALRCALVVALVLFPVVVLLRAKYGYWLPNAYYVKSNAGLANLHHGLRYLLKAIPRYGLVVGATAAVAGFRLLGERGRPFAQPSVLFGIVALWIGYTAAQGGDNMVGGRMLIPALPLAYVGLVCFLQQTRAKYLLALVAALGVALVLSYINDARVMRHAHAWRRDFPVRREAGIYLRDNFPPRTKVALSPAGVIPYYSGLPTLDMLGLNDEYIAQHGKRDYRLPFGHQAGDGEYVLSQRPDVILFGGALSALPGDFISDQELWWSPEFHEAYRRVRWEGIGYAYVRGVSGQPTAPGRDPPDSE